MSQLPQIEFQDRRLKPLGHPSAWSSNRRYYLWDKELSRCHPDGPGRATSLLSAICYGLRYGLELFQHVIVRHLAIPFGQPDRAMAEYLLQRFLRAPGFKPLARKRVACRTRTP
jgi:hypothetical protein